MQISDVDAVVRHGQLIDAESNSWELQAAIGAAASELMPTETEIFAPSATAAAAWLLEVAHLNALGQRLPSSTWPFNVDRFPYDQNNLVGFRGQKRAYTTIKPTLYRKPLAQRRIHTEAAKWFKAAASAWHNTYFRYSDGSSDDGGLGVESAVGMAQHYGLGTFLVDWTWDPLVAMAFASADLKPGEFGAVYLFDFGAENPPRSYNVLLPPTLAKRVWRQRGLFHCHPAPPEQWDNPILKDIIGEDARLQSETEAYLRVVFPAQPLDIEWAKYRVSELKEDPLEFSALADWCIDVASRNHRLSWRSGSVNVMRQSDFADECVRLGIDLPQILSVPPSADTAREDVGEMMNYLDMMALRCHPQTGKLCYFIPALLTAVAGMEWNSWPMRKGDDAEKIDRRAVIFKAHGQSRAVDEWQLHLNKLKLIKSSIDEQSWHQVVYDEFFVDQ